ncbi:hypothetical protein N9A28_09860 [Sulfurimonas sp.]|nr:hypothetical protein [Sulfurimonas sp.]
MLKTICMTAFAILFVGCSSHTSSLADSWSMGYDTQDNERTLYAASTQDTSNKVIYKTRYPIECKVNSVIWLIINEGDEFVPLSFGKHTLKGDNLYQLELNKSTLGLSLAKETIVKGNVIREYYALIYPDGNYASNRMKIIYHNSLTSASKELGMAPGDEGHLTGSESSICRINWAKVGAKYYSKGLLEGPPFELIQR